MLFLPAAALCCLCSALVAMAAELSQDHLTLTRRVGQTVSFSCEELTSARSNMVHWYQKKDTFTKIVQIDMKNGKVHSGYNHPQKDDFSSVNKKNGWELQIQTVKLSHSATYYCSCEKSSYLIFGSGTKLYVTDEQIVKPVVNVYPAASRAHLEGKSSLLCVASDMFPPLVRFSWKRQKDNGPLEKVTSADKKQLKLKESGCTATILQIPQRESSTYRYRCFVQHEGETVEAQIKQEVSTLPPPTTSPSPQPSLPPSLQPSLIPSPPPSLIPAPPVSVPSQYQVKLLCLMYTVLIVKSLVYCCGLSLLMILRNKGPSTNCTHAD
ncbi:immunoglobulin lambda-1 light chain-like [Dicentrarchus labrax]|uniref:immunoglobulin lambda-1 light chain-like n=1 Tax=Dicentrarchus labrax TaxID=13489 RepID=UPI0021F66436|nr:immunoglobulin lambda-1 light chain-like [Dicentrarchus labrax]